MNGIILAAGLGERLMPITAQIPKPLLPIVDKPVIAINIERLKKLGIKNIGINLHYQPKKIACFLKKIKNIKIAFEDILLGTGGALLNFKDLITDDFLIHNCDVLSSINLKQLIRIHKKEKPFATIVITKNRGSNLVKFVDNRILGFFKKEEKTFFTYTGIAVLSKRIFSYLPTHKKSFSLIEIYNKAINNGEFLLGLPVKEVWYDVGSYNTYWQVHRDILQKKIEIDGLASKSSIYIHPTSIVKSKNLSGFVCTQKNSFIAKDVHLKNTIVFENSRIKKGNFVNCLLSDKFCIKIPN